MFGSLGRSTGEHGAKITSSTDFGNQDTANPAALSQKEGLQPQGKLKGTNGSPGNQGKKDDAADPQSAARDKAVQEHQSKGEGESDVQLEQVRETATGPTSSYRMLRNHRFRT